MNSLLIIALCSVLLLVTIAGGVGALIGMIAKTSPGTASTPRTHDFIVAD